MSRVSLSLVLALVAALPLAAGPFPEADMLKANKDLPDPLLMLDGSRVRTPEEWRTKRAPELRKLIQHYMYGFFPAAPARVEARVVREDKNALGGKATLREIELTMAGPNAPKVHVLLVIPNNRQGPAPVFVGMNFTANFTLLTDPATRLPT